MCFYLIWLVFLLMHSSKKNAYNAICCCERVSLWLMNELSARAAHRTCHKAQSLFTRPYLWKHHLVRETLPQLEFVKCVSSVPTTQFKKTPAEKEKGSSNPWQKSPQVLTATLCAFQNIYSESYFLKQWRKTVPGAAELLHRHLKGTWHFSAL